MVIGPEHQRQRGPPAERVRIAELQHPEDLAGLAQVGYPPGGIPDGVPHPAPGVHQQRAAGHLRHRAERHVLRGGGQVGGLGTLDHHIGGEPQQRGEQEVELVLAGWLERGAELPLGGWPAGRGAPRSSLGG